MGQPAEAAVTILRRQRLWPDNPGELYGAAREFSLCIPLVVRGRSRSAALERSEGERYGELAMAALREAISAGYRDVTEMRRDTKLDPLRSRSDFQALLLDLAFPADPFAPAN